MPNILQTGMDLLAKDLATVPPENDGALVVIVDRDSVRFGVVAKFNERWHMSAELTQQWEKKLPDAKFMIEYSWKRKPQ